MGLFSGTDSEVTFRNDVTSDNLVWKFERGTKNAVVRINDFWSVAQLPSFCCRFTHHTCVGRAISLNYWTHFCGTIGDNVMGVYRDGVAMDAVRHCFDMLLLSSSYYVPIDALYYAR
jgi:hypothetical protein